jgi:Tripartite tricarboxylate transporter TctB family
MALLGVLIVAKGVTAAAADGEIGPVPWRGVVLILAALVYFGACIRGLGLVPSLFGAALLSALASRRNGPLSALVIASALTLLCIVIFHYGLGLAVPLVGPWLGR